MTQTILPKSICVFRHEDEIFVSEYWNVEKEEPFYRPIGGRIEFGERSETALEREIHEELGNDVDIENVHRLGLIENIYHYKNKLSHELMFIFEGEFTDEKWYEINRFKAYEHTSDRMFKVEWIPVQDFIDGDKTLYPEGILDIILNKKTTQINTYKTSKEELSISDISITPSL